MYTIQKPLLEKLLEYLSGRGDFVFLDTSRPDSENSRSLLFMDPVDRKQCRTGEDPVRYLQELQQLLEEGYYLAGWFGYEFGVILETDIDVYGKPRSPGPELLADFGVFRKPRVFDHLTGEHNLPGGGSPPMNGTAYTLSNLRSNMKRDEFVHALGKVREYIGAGDTYQVNYTMKLHFDFEGSPEKLYLDLRRNQSVAYGAYIRNGAERMLSFSPELFFRRDRSGITVRPMKGTAKRGRNVIEETAYAEYLHNDGKNRSENVMIVDLLRNDLARLVHGYGRSSVDTDSLFDVESYESLLQMTSTVRARTSDFTMEKISLVELFMALFPCGSITGAPKIRTMEIIDELEKEQRGVYTGAIGYLAPDMTGAFNVPIRTVRLWQNNGEMGIGAGITYDSDPDDEWRESLLKGRFLTHSQPDFSLFETMLWQPDSGFLLLEEHLARLALSAGFFKFSFHDEIIRVRLRETVSAFDGSGCRRVRLLLRKDGRVDITRSECQAPLRTSLPSRPARENGLPLVAFSETVVDSEKIWFYHKTTHRDIFDTAFKNAGEMGCFDLLFCNERDEVTEGSITNLILYDGGRYLTPPLSCGLLGGVMREKLLADTAVKLQEEIITREMVRNAEALFVCNSVRGVVQVRLLERN
ncbi:aminodeoxychorismate synthase component I [Desulfomarina sp.]